jgi:hypothetical protein
MSKKSIKIKNVSEELENTWTKKVVIYFVEVEIRIRDVENIKKSHT